MTGCYKSSGQPLSESIVSKANAATTNDLSGDHSENNTDDDFFNELDEEYETELSAESDSAKSSDTPPGIIEEFAAGQFKGWNERVFEGTTSYQPVIREGRTVLEATANSSASLLFKQQTVDLGSTPILEWTWKITGTYAPLASGQVDERSRAGDDFPARIYVVFRNGPLPRDALAVNYIWSSRAPIGSYWPNPYQKNAVMMVVDSGDSRAGQWVTHTRNVAEDFKQIFNKDISKLDGYAVMVDGDNTGSATTSWFDKLSFSAASDGMLQ